MARPLRQLMVLALDTDTDARTENGLRRTRCLHCRAHLTVADDGAGVSEDDLPRLFERFFRADRVRGSRGTGLGLAVVKHIVAAGGGTVEAEGAPGHGLTITCAFPAR